MPFESASTQVSEVQCERQPGRVSPRRGGIPAALPAKLARRRPIAATGLRLFRDAQSLTVLQWPVPGHSGRNAAAPCLPASPARAMPFESASTQVSEVQCERQPGRVSPRRGGIPAALPAKLARRRPIAATGLRLFRDAQSLTVLQWPVPGHSGRNAAAPCSSPLATIAFQFRSTIATISTWETRKTGRNFSINTPR
ncbi:MAG: hypothetical protein ACI9VS_000723, partial [Candidatus Binatia bacterium]